MNKIIEYLSDPAWWFTAVFVAIIASIIAGFLKETISKVLSAVSTSYRNRKQLRDKKIEESINRIINDPVFLTLSVFRALTGEIVTLMFVTIFNVFYALRLSGVISVATPSYNAVMFNIMLLVIGVAAVYGRLKTNPRTKLLLAAYRKYVRDINKNAQQQNRGDRE